MASIEIGTHRLALALRMAVCLAVCAASFGQTTQSSLSVETEAGQLVEQMRGFSMRGQANGPISPREQRRREIIGKLRRLGKEAIPALTRALTDQDVQMRRNAELVMIDLAGTYSGEPRVDIRMAIPALIKATGDSDRDVRGWAAHALAEVGPDAKDAIPALLKLLKDPEEGPRNTSCIALGRIGPAAKDALPALREALHDPSEDVRRFAEQAIKKIQQQ